MIAVGIDPGVHTGCAIWDVTGYEFRSVGSVKLHEAMAVLHTMKRAGELAEGIVIFEDARQRRWFGSRDKNQDKYGAGVREGVGSVKRDCLIWEEFLSDLGVPFIARSPKSGSTKKNARHFEVLTGWKARTNEHARDAALIVYGLNAPMVKGLVLDFQSRQKGAAT